MAPKSARLYVVIRERRVRASARKCGALVAAVGCLRARGADVLQHTRTHSLTGMRYYTRYILNGGRTADAEDTKV